MILHYSGDARSVLSPFPRFCTIQNMKTLAEKLRSEQCARILVALADGSKSADELVIQTKLTAGSVAKHVDVLIEAGRIRRIARGRFSLRR